MKAQSWRVSLFAVTLLMPAFAGTLPTPAFADGQTIKTADDFKKDFIRPASVPFPADNPFTAEKAQLGEMLFFDPRLSGSNWISCASCHNPSMAWGDGLPRGIGTGMKTLGRRTPTILNLAWAELLMWDGRKTGLEDQALGPVTAAVEMDQDVDKLIEKLSAIKGYPTEFERVFGVEGLSPKTIGQAIATYERTIVSGSAPFDRWIAGDENAIQEPAKRGFGLFNGKANCAACHSGWNLTDNGFHDVGMPDKDIGRGEWLKIASMQQAFKTPTLRDIDRRAPYMHDGSLKNLAAVIDHYDRGGTARPSLSDDVRPLGLSEAEKSDLLAFLLTLTGDNPTTRLPVLFPASQGANR
ncbi:MAG TPA: cytochrome c peroxidase [Stellaceae bacterium]|nr:cytochrome c peroxidase [Stellaceae bacterium]